MCYRLMLLVLLPVVLLAQQPAAPFNVEEVTVQDLLRSLGSKTVLLDNANRIIAALDTQLQAAQQQLAACRQPAAVPSPQAPAGAPDSEPTPMPRDGGTTGNE